MEITFTNPSYLWFILVIPLIIFAHFISLRFIRRKALKFANFPAIEYVTGERILSKNYTLLLIRLITIFLLILAVSGATLWYEAEISDADYVIAIDASGSMLANDFKPNRLEAAKNSAILFIESVKERSKIGVISFAGISYLKQTLTNDFTKVKESIKNISVELVGGTAIGSAIISSVNLLENSEKAKVLILLTDGQSNVGPSVEEALNYAKEKHVTIHTIGIGTEQGGGFPEMNLSFTSKLDEETLKKIAKETGGNYYYAKTEDEIKNAYEEISTKTKGKLSINLSLIFLILALILLALEWILVNTKFRTLP
ncbi:MAG: VWA domain-containing protein [Candidatus Aenigmatarchaeota archaeon]